MSKQELRDREMFLKMIGNCQRAKRSKKMPRRIIRYRKPSVKTLLGVTRAKKRFNKAVGITAVKKPFRAPGNFKRRVLRRSGYYSEPMKLFRFIGRLFK
jgi:hypothetical protein